jgi:hypothetical protein
MANLPEAERSAMGRRTAEVVADWGPERFASGMIDAIAMAGGPGRQPPSMDTHRGGLNSRRRGVRA